MCLSASFDCILGKFYTYLSLLFLVVCSVTPGQALSQCVGTEDFAADITNGCQPASIRFAASGFGSGAAFSWDFGSGFNGSNLADSVKYHLFSGVGNYTVRLRVDYPGGFCVKTRTNYISVTNGPVVKLYIDKPILCDFADSITIIDSTSGVVSRDFVVDGVLYRNWGPRLRHKFSSAGSKQISVKFQTSSGCFASWSNDSAVVAHKPPIVSFNSQSNMGCAPVKALFVPFVNTYNGMTITDYNWSFPNGAPSVSTQTQPQIVYTSVGKYDATLTVKASNGCAYQNARKGMVDVYPVPAPVFSSVDTLLCNKTDVHLVNTTSGVYPGNYSWVIPPGSFISETTSDSDSVTVSLPAISGKYDFGLKYAVYNCYADTFRKKYVQLSQTKALLNSPEQNFCKVPATVNFNDSGSYTDVGFSYSVKWRIRDSIGTLVDSSVAKLDSFTFKKFGKYNLELYIKSTNGCNDSAINSSFYVIGPPKPAIGFSKKRPCPGETVTFNDQTPGFAPKVYYQFRTWILYDRDFTTVLKTDTNKQLKYAFQDTGTYKVRLLVWNTLGCKDSLTDSVTLRVASPVMDFNIDKTGFCRNETFKLEGNVNPATPGIIYNWEIVNDDDSAYSYYENNANPLFKTVGGPGHYSVKCTAFTAACTTSLVKKNLFFVSGTLYKGTFDSLIGCKPFSAQLKAEKVFNVQQDGSDSGLTYQWFSTPAGAFFSDSTKMNTTVTFNNGGCYQVGILAINGDGCQSNWLNVINTCIGNNAKFNVPNVVCFGDSIRVVNISSMYAKRYKWLIQGPRGKVDPVPSDTAYNVSWKPEIAGDYSIKLYATTNTGCVDSFEKNVTSQQPKASLYTPDSVGNCGPYLARFYYNGSPGVNYIWYWGDQTFPLNNVTGAASHLYDIKNGRNRFTVSVRMFDAYGCTDSITMKDIVRINGPVPYFVPDRISGCDPLTVSFSNQSRNAYRSVFFDDLGNADSAAADTFRITYNLKMSGDSASSYFPYLVASDSSGTCVKAYKITDTIRVYRKPEASFQFSDSLICLNQSVRFSSTSKGSEKIRWDFDGDGLWDDTTSLVSHRFKKKGYFYPMLVAMNKGGCPDTARAALPIEVFPVVKGSIYVSSKYICQGDSVFIYNNTDTIYQGKLEFRWKFRYSGNVIDSANVPYPVKLFKDTGDYDISLVIINAAGCADTINYLKAFRINERQPYVGANLQFVTLQDNKNIKISWRRDAAQGFRSYLVYKTDVNGKKLLYTTTNVDDTNFTDTLVVNPSAYSSVYEVLASEDCHDLPLSGVQHAQMVLNASSYNLNAIKLTWNAYEAWKGDVVYDIYRSVDGLKFLKVNSTKLTSWIDKKVCDSLYYYRIEGVQTSGDFYTSLSNISAAKPIYMPDTQPADIKSVSVLNESEIEVRWDTGFAFGRSKQYTLLSSVAPYVQWTVEWSGKADRASIPLSNYEPVSRFTVMREDICGFFSDTGLYGTNVYLEAYTEADTALMHWTSYEKTRKGVRKYLIQWFDPVAGNFIPLVQLNGKDTSGKDSILHDLYSEKFCYRIASISNDYPNDTSYSNVSCVSYSALVFIPNTFTPNGDPWNECFRPVISFVYGDVSIENLKYTFSIYDRWGEKLFETHDPQACWDGNFNGKPAPSGTYIYRYVAVGFKDKEKLTGSGPFLLLR